MDERRIRFRGRDGDISWHVIAARLVDYFRVLTNNAIQGVEDPRLHHWAHQLLKDEVGNSIEHIQSRAAARGETAKLTLAIHLKHAGVVRLY